MKKFKELYNQICEDIKNEQKYAIVSFKGSVEKCPLKIKNAMRQIFSKYTLSDRFLYNRLKVVVKLDDNLVNISFDNPGSISSPRTVYIGSISTTPAGAEAREKFNDLAQQFIDWCNEENINLEDFEKTDNPAAENFNLFLVSDAFISAISNDK